MIINFQLMQVMLLEYADLISNKFFASFDDNFE